MPLPYRSLFALALLPGALAAQAPRANPLKHDPRATTTAITAADLMTRVYIFADDSMQGREAGTLGNFKGTGYIGGELARLGLTPGGENGTFFQTLPLQRTSIDETTTVEVEGEELAPFDDYLIFPPIAQLPGFGATFNAAATPVVFGGRIGSATLVSPDVVAGRLVLFAAPDGQGAWQFWGRMGPQQMQRYSRAAGILVATLDLTPGPAIGFLASPQVSLADSSAPPPALRIMLVSDAVGEFMMGAPLRGLLPGAEGKKVTARGGFVRGPTEAPGRNVVAVVPGADPKLAGEYVAFGAHNDHEGYNEPVDHDSLRAFNAVVRPNGADDFGNQPTPEQLARVARLHDSLARAGVARRDSIMNGADDDGSGSMALLELAEYFVKNPARRSLLFVWHVAEEKGLWGAEWFTDHPTVPRDSIVAQINLDMIGRGGAGDTEGGGPAYLQSIGSRRLSTKLGDLIEEVNTKGKHGFTFDYRYDAAGHPGQFYCRSDHYMYARYGIPVVFLSTGSHRDYHMVTDEPQYLDYDKLARVTGLVMDVARTVANLDQRLPVDQPKPDPKGECRQ